MTGTAAESTASSDPVLTAFLRANRARINQLFRGNLLDHRDKTPADLYWLILGPLRRFTAISFQNETERDELLYETLRGFLKLSNIGVISPLHDHVSENLFHLVSSTSREIRSEIGSSKLIAILLNSLLKIDPSLQPNFAFRFAQSLPQIHSTIELESCASFLLWVCGCGGYRELSLESAKDLPEHLLQSLCQSSLDRSLLIDKLNQWPLADVLTEIDVWRLGGFKGFGGRFVKPPLVKLDLRHIWVTDEIDFFKVTFDRFSEAWQRQDSSQIAAVFGDQLGRGYQSQWSADFGNAKISVSPWSHFITVRPRHGS